MMCCQLLYVAISTLETLLFNLSINQSINEREKQSQAQWDEDTSRYVVLILKPISGLESYEGQRVTRARELKRAS